MIFMTTVGDIYRAIDSFAPFSSQMDFDNAGLLAGDKETEVRTAILSLDITPDVVHEAARKKAQLVVSHHPVIFHPLRNLRPGSAPYLLAQYNIAAICAHTNLDMAPGGVNDSLAGRLNLKDAAPLVCDSHSGRPAALKCRTEREFLPRKFAEFVKSRLGCDGLFYADGRRKIDEVGLCSGSGAEYLYDAAASGCQAFVTGEAKHNELIDAKNLGITLVVAGHYYTENVVIGPLLNRLSESFPDVAFLRTEVFSCPEEYL